MLPIHQKMALLSSLACLAGCGFFGRGYDGAQRFPLSGQVTVNGEPLDGGSISFIPQDQNGRVSGGPIVQGRYQVEATKGANAGAYTVRIHCPKPTGKKHYDEDTMEMVTEFQESIPLKFNKFSELSVEVSKSQQEFDFDLKL